MAAPKPRSAGERLRHAADQLYALAERADTEQRGIHAVQQLHDAIETVAADVRAVVRGSARQVNPPLCIEARPDGSMRAGW